MPPQAPESVSRKEGEKNVQNLSAQEAPEKEGARLPQENGYQKWTEGPRPQKSKGQTHAYAVSYNGHIFCVVFLFMRSYWSQGAAGPVRDAAVRMGLSYGKNCLAYPQL